MKGNFIWKKQNLPLNRYLDRGRYWDRPQLSPQLSSSAHSPLGYLSPEGTGAHCESTWILGGFSS